MTAELGAPMPQPLPGALPAGTGPPVVARAGAVVSAAETWPAAGAQALGAHALGAYASGGQVSGGQVSGGQVSGGQPLGAQASGAQPAGARPLVLIADSDLLDDVLRASAAASVPVEVVPDPGAARRAWSDAPLVVVGDDTAAAVAQVGLPRRSGVVLVGREPPDPDIWQRGLQVGAEDVVFVPEADEWLANRLADAAEGDVRTGALICVVGGRGGAGASTLAAGLAVSGTRRGWSCLLVDADPLGGGLDLALGYENTDGLRWPQLAESRGRISAAALQHALPTGPSRRGSRLPSLGAVPLPLISCDRTDLTDVPADGMAAI